MRFNVLQYVAVESMMRPQAALPTSESMSLHSWPGTPQLQDKKRMKRSIHHTQHKTNIQDLR
eukprot:scaffold653117_cov61-Prasinocladus_malaysianus.AAC.1